MARERRTSPADPARVALALRVSRLRHRHLTHTACSRSMRQTIAYGTRGQEGAPAARAVDPPPVHLTRARHAGPGGPPASMRTRRLAPLGLMGGDDFVSTIIVTGGAGYIGSMVSRELLARGHSVVVADALLFGGEALLDLLSNPAFSFRKVDICVPAELEALFAERAVRRGGPSRPRSFGDSGLQGAGPSSPTRHHLRRLAEPASRSAIGTWRRPFLCSPRTSSDYGRRSETDAVHDRGRTPPPGRASTRGSRFRFEELLLARAVALDFTVLRFATVYGLSLRPPLRPDHADEFARDALLTGELAVLRARVSGSRPTATCAEHRERRRHRSSSRIGGGSPGGCSTSAPTRRTIGERAIDGGRRPSRSRFASAACSGPRTHATTGSPSSASPPSGSRPGCACATASARVADAIASGLVSPDPCADPVPQLLRHGTPMVPLSEPRPSAGASSSTSPAA